MQSKKSREPRQSTGSSSVLGTRRRAQVFQEVRKKSQKWRRKTRRVESGRPRDLGEDLWGRGPMQKRKPGR